MNTFSASSSTAMNNGVSENVEKIFAFVCIAAAIALWAVCTLPWSFANELSDDTVVFSYVAQRMLAGDVLFRDVWDHKGPLIFMLNAAGLWLGGGSYGGIKAVEFLMMSAAAMLLYLSLMRFAGRRFAALTTLAATAAMRVPLGEGNFTEEYAVFFQALALYFLVRLEIESCRRAGLCAFVIGFAGACAFFFRANLTGFWLVIGIYWIVKAAVSKDYKSFFRKLLWAAVPVVLMGGGFALYFGWNGALWGFLEGLIFHNIRYSQDVSLPLWAKAGKMLALGQSTYPFGPLVVIGSIILVRGWLKKRYPLVFVFAVVWLAVEVLLSSLAGYPYQHYIITWVLPASGLTVLVLYSLAEWLAERLNRVSMRLVVSASIAVLAVLSALPAFTKAAELYGQHNQKTGMTKYIVENSSEWETVYFYESFDAKNQFFGAKCLSSLFFANRKLPTPYVYSSFYLPVSDEFRQKMVDAMYEGWLKSPPALVIFLPKKEDSFWFLIDPRIEEMVSRNYQKAAELDGFLIYKPKKVD